MSKHTPGPWVVKETPHGKGHQRTIGRETNIFYPVARIVGDPRSASKNGANALLIAAVPDLLEAAKLVRQAWANHSLDADLGGWFEAIEAIRTAANKAEGKAKSATP